MEIFFPVVSNCGASSGAGLQKIGNFVSGFDRDISGFGGVRVAPEVRFWRG